MGDMKKSLWTKLIVFGLALVIGFFGILPTPSTDFVVYAAEEEEEITPEPANLIERAISYVFLFASTGLFFLISLAAGMPLTVETLIFNKYPNTSLNLFQGMGQFNTYIGNPGVSGTIAKSVNDFYSFFVKIAVVAYMVILLYVGVRILLNAGTDKQAKYKEYLLYWVEGIVILFFFPYIMKYTIIINNTFVEYIYNNKGIAGTLMAQPETQAAAGGMSGMESGVQGIINTLKGGTDYMSVMFLDGWEKGWLVYAICFSVMVMQVLMLLIIYFKRLLIIVFLIVCFPFVTISYAIDKLGDGKSQAFGNWYKEFALNVFTNSFHAIIYVIGMAFITELGRAAGRNWLLMIILLSFVSKGDEMLRGLFNLGKGGGGDTVKSIGKTMLKAKGAATAIEGAAGAANAMFGKDSKFAQAKNVLGAVNNARLDQKVAKEHEAGAMLDEALANQAAQNAPEAPEMNAPQSLADAAQTALSKDATDAEKDAALDQILDVMNMQEGAEKEALLNELMSGLTEEQAAELDSMLTARAAANAIMAGGLTEVQLNENIEILLEQLKGNNSSEAARIARSIVGDPKNLERLRLAAKMKLKKPGAAGANIANTGQKRDKTKKGGRYSGTFIQSASAQKMALARAALQPKDTSLRGRIVNSGANMVGRFTRATQQAKANAHMAWAETKALAQATFRGKGRHIDEARRLREAYAKKGIYFNGVSRISIAQKINSTSRTVGRTVFTKKGRQAFRQQVGQGIVQTWNRAGQGINQAWNTAGKAAKNVGANIVDLRDQGRDIIDIARLRNKARRGTATDRARANREAESILKRRNEQRDQLRARGVKLTKNFTESAYNFNIVNKARMQELRAMAGIAGAELSRAGEIIARRKEGDKRVVDILDQSRTKEAALLRSRGIVVRPPSISSAAARVVDAGKASRFSHAGREKRKKAKENWHETMKTTFDSTRAARKEAKQAQADLEAARKAVRAADGDPAKLEIARKQEQAALEALRTANAKQIAGAEAIKASRKKVQEAGVILRLPSRIDKRVERSLEQQYQGARKAERLAETEAARATRHREEQEALANSIQLVDLRALAGVKQAARDGRKKYEARESMMAETLRSIQEERAVLQQSVRDAGIVTSKQGAGSKISERLIAAGNGLKDAPATVLDGGKRLVEGSIALGKGVIEVSSDIHDAVVAVPGVVAEIPGAVAAAPGAVLSAFKEMKDLAGAAISGTFGKNADGLSLGAEIMAVAGRRQEEKMVINGFVTESSKPEVVMGTEPTASSPTVVVVGNTPTASTEGKWVVSVNTPTEVDLARRNVEKAKQEAAERAKAENPNADPDATKLSAFEENTLFQISCSVVALNQIDLGQYTASEVVSHIDNIKRLQSAFPPGSEGYEQLTSILAGLKYPLDDMESNVRIQVLNDPSLIAGNDPHRGALLDSSITYVQGMAADDVMLGMLHYEPSDLEVGFTPVSRSREVVQGIAARGLVTLTEAEDASVRSAVEASVREHNRATAQRDREEASSRLLASVGEFAKVGAEAAVDIAVGMPIGVGTGLVATGMTGSGFTGLAAYSLGDGAYKGVKGVVTDIGGDVASAIGGAFKSKGKSSGSKTPAPSEPLTYEVAREQAIAAKRAKYNGRTSVAKAGEEGSLTDRFKKYKAENA